MPLSLLLPLPELLLLLLRLLALMLRRLLRLLLLLWGMRRSWGRRQGHGAGGVRQGRPRPGLRCSGV